jgi:uncharacterized Zn-finger protein
MFETIEVSNEEVACDGGGALGHPRVYLHIDHDHGNKVVCPYCSRTYLLRHARAGMVA